MPDNIRFYFAAKICVVKRMCMLENTEIVRWLKSILLKSLDSECCPIRKNASGPQMLSNSLTGTEYIFFSHLSNLELNKSGKWQF